MQVGPGYYAQAGRSASSLGIPRFHAQRPKSPKSRTRSLAGSSPRLEYSNYKAAPPTMASVESQEWYSGYQHQVPHDAEFGSSGSFGGLNYDGRIQAAIGREGNDSTPEFNFIYFREHLKMVKITVNV